MKKPKKKTLRVLVQEQSGCSPEEAERLIWAGKVRVNSAPADKPGYLYPADGRVEIPERKKYYATRGGLKLKQALEAFSLSVTGKTVLDAGAAEGGFTDCLLKEGAAAVIAADVGYGILDYRLRRDPRVRVKERCNVRFLRTEDLPPCEAPLSLITADLSFISLASLLPVFQKLLRESPETAEKKAVIGLLKPQFEAPAEAVPPGGIIQDPALYLRVIQKFLEASRQNDFFLQGLSFSPVKGRKGNREFLVCLGTEEAKAPEASRKPQRPFMTLSPEELVGEALKRLP